MHVEDKSKAFRQVVRKDQLAKLEEVKKAPEHWQPQNFNGRRKLVNPVRRNLELKSKFKVGVRLNVRVKLKSKSSHKYFKCTFPYPRDNVYFFSQMESE